MIIIGYQGIGKSTLAGKNNIIDLESGNFWNNGVRPTNWYIYYCNIAEHLSQQGYIVFVSSHEVVRNRLKNSKEKIYAIYPSLELRDKWVVKLKDRYDNSKLEKDYKALVNAVDRYYQNIEELKNSEIESLEIKNMDYKLSDMVNYLSFSSGNISIKNNIDDSNFINQKINCMVCDESILLNYYGKRAKQLGANIYKICDKCKSAILKVRNDIEE